ncbi:hypothetical protein MFRU_007g02170 [Monilinia fructicola]|nr:hypothetical protein MFRU_007g02170 [Monilinia fructicola]
MTDFTREGSHSSSGVSEFGSEYDFEPYNAAYQSDDDDDQADDDDKSFGNKSDDLEAEEAETTQSESGQSFMSQITIQIQRDEAYLKSLFKSPLEEDQFGDLDLFTHAGRVQARTKLMDQPPEVIVAIEKTWNDVNREFHRSVYEIMKCKDEAVTIEGREDRFTKRQADLDKLIKMMESNEKLGGTFNQSFFDHIDKRLVYHEKFDAKNADLLGKSLTLEALVRLFEQRGQNHRSEALRHYFRRGRYGLDLLNKQTTRNQAYLVMSVHINTANGVWHRDLGRLHYAIHKVKVENGLPLDLRSEYKFDQWKDFYAEEFKREDEAAKDN